MKTRCVLLFLLSLPLLSYSQSQKDTLAIMSAIDGYLQGWNTGDSARMANALHPALVKRIVKKDEAGKPW